MSSDVLTQKATHSLFVHHTKLHLKPTECFLSARKNKIKNCSILFQINSETQNIILSLESLKLHVQ